MKGKKSKALDVLNGPFLIGSLTNYYEIYIFRIAIASIIQAKMCVFNHTFRLN